MSDEQPLISIIIPTYNRAHLIGETLDSVLVQTYQNWECVVVDDGSTDNTDEVMAAYMAKDARFQYHHRPPEKTKGANACRNAGLDLAAGEYIVFFDSDDLMTPDHLKVKISAIQAHRCDYVITRTEFFGGNKKDNENTYRFDQYPLTAYHYVSQAINWLTPDACIKRSVAQSIRFNESLQAGQEFNYFSKLVHRSVAAVFIDKTVTLRRYHKESIRANLNTGQKSNESLFRACWETYVDLNGIADQKTKRALLKTSVSSLYENKMAGEWNKKKFIKAIFKAYGSRGVYFLLLMLNLKLFGRGYYFYRKLTST